MMYGSWDIKCKGQSFLSFWVSFFPFDSPNNPKNHNFEQIKKAPKDIIIVDLCTTIDNHMMYGFRDIEHNRHNLLLFLPIFCPFPRLTTQRIKILKKWKSSWRFHHFTQVHHKWQSYDIWFLRYEVQQTEYFCCIGPFFALLPL